MTISGSCSCPSASHRPDLTDIRTSGSNRSRAVQHADGTIKTGGTDRAASPSPTIQARIDALNAKAAAAPPPSADDSAHQTIITVEDLKAAWGTDDAAYDLNADGTVNIDDLLALLAEGGTMTRENAPITIEGVRQAMSSGNLAYDVNHDGAVNINDLLQVLAEKGGPTETDGDEASSAHQPVITVEDLKAAWGTDDAAYDLNADGTVNVDDLLALLAEGGTMTRENAPITVEGVRQAMSSGNLAYDINGDGAVNISDLLQALADMNADKANAPQAGGGLETAMADRSAGEAPAAAAPMNHEKPAADPLPVAINDARSASDAPGTASNTERLRGIANAIHQRLTAAGYDHRPPANLHALLDRLELPRPDRQMLLARLGERYPEGLGFDRVG